MNIFFKLIKKILSIQDIYFNKNIIGRTKNINKPKAKNIPINKGQYWDVISKRIIEASNYNDGKNFFQDPDVVLHLASENVNLGYKLINKIRSHSHGEDMLNKVRTPAWGSPFLLKNYPYLSPTTASHLANLLSIEECFNKKITEFRSILDFGGGYGGLVQCINQLSNSTNISIVDISDMIEVQKKYLSKTGFLKNINFYSDLNNISDKQFEIFNASFSMSEINSNERNRIKNFIEKNCLRVHIIFQENFNEINNLSFFENFASELKLNNWEVSLVNYKWYEWANTRLLYGKNLNFYNK